VLTSVAGTYLAPVASTNGQTGGFLHTALGPAVEGGRRVLYLGDLDYAGGHIEENTRRVLEDYGELEWERIAITDVQVRERSLPMVSKPDRRFNPRGPHILPAPVPHTGAFFVPRASPCLPGLAVLARDYRRGLFAYIPVLCPRRQFLMCKR
jgi:hypothetical protein